MDVESDCENKNEKARMMLHKDVTMVTQAYIAVTLWSTIHLHRWGHFFTRRCAWQFTGLTMIISTCPIMLFVVDRGFHHGTKSILRVWPKLSHLLLPQN